jgi:hypothetical protein
MHTLAYIYWRFPLAFCSPSESPLLTWNPPCCDRIRPPWSQVARKLISSFPSLPICPPSVPHLFSIQSPDPLWFSQFNAPFTKTTSQLWFPRPAQLALHAITLLVSMLKQTFVVSTPCYNSLVSMLKHTFVVSTPCYNSLVSMLKHTFLISTPC